MGGTLHRFDDSGQSPLDPAAHAGVPGAMHCGVTMFRTDYSMRVDELARAAETRGFESLWLPEHTHIPVSRRSPWPGGPNLPQEYSHTLDPFVALTAAAAVTTRLKLGTGICLVVERDPITTAKAVASLDHLSNRRVLFGIGGGCAGQGGEGPRTRSRPPPPPGPPSLRCPQS